MSDKYLNTGLQAGCEVLKRLMAEISPNVYYSIKEIAAKCEDLGDYHKIYRIVYTLHKVGFLQEKDGRFRIGDDMLFLSQRYMLSLAALHRQIVTEAQKFEGLFRSQEVN